MIPEQDQPSYVPPFNFSAATRNDIVRLFNLYDFRDPIGHPLTNCQDFQSLLDLSHPPEGGSVSNEERIIELLTSINDRLEAVLETQTATAKETAMSVKILNRWDSEGGPHCGERVISPRQPTPTEG